MSRLAAGEAAVEWSGLGEVEEVDNEPKFGSRLGSSKLVENVPGGLGPPVSQTTGPRRE
jgi:hypothetical protein